MKDLIDQPDLPKQRKRLLNLISLLSVFIAILVIILIAVKVIDEVKSRNPLLPSYAFFFLHGQLINFGIFLVFGLSLGIFLRIIKRYMLSMICLLLFTFAGLFLKDQVLFYEWFYWII